VAALSGIYQQYFFQKTQDGTLHEKNSLLRAVVLHVALGQLLVDW
jgi:hypothetical protein